MTSSIFYLIIAVTMAFVVFRWLTFKKDLLILLCCASGARSGMAAKILTQHGFTTVINIGSCRNLLTSACKTN